MTIATTTSSITYQANGVTTNWSFPFVSGGVNSDIVVILTNSSGTQTTLLQSQYTLLFNSIPTGGLWSIGGSVIYPITGSPLATGNYLTIERTVPYIQNTSINNQGAFYPQAVETAIDTLVLQIQQLLTQVNFAIQAPIVDLNPLNPLPPAAERANLYLVFDSNGQPQVSNTAPPPAQTTAAQPRKVSVSGTNTITMLTTDSFGGISVYQSPGSVTTVQLPSLGGPYPVYDGSLNTPTLPLTILPPGAKTILGQSSYILNSAGGSVVFSLDPTQVVVD